MNKVFQTNEKDIDIRKTEINLHVYTETSVKKFCLLSPPTDRKRIPPFTSLSLSDVFTSYPLCRNSVKTYEKSIVKCGEKCRNPKLSDILTLINSLVENYGNDTKIYMTDGSCWKTDDFIENPDSIMQLIYSLLTTKMTELGVLHGGKTRKLYKKMRNRKKSRKTLTKHFRY
jgi:hypothetical protein